MFMGFFSTPVFSEGLVKAKAREYNNKKGRLWQEKQRKVPRASVV